MTQTRTGGRNFDTVTIKNPSQSLAFMIWLRLQNAADGKPIRPAFYDDNFLSLLPGESRTVRIEYSGALAPAQTKLIVDGWNVVPQEFHNGQRKTLPVRARTVVPQETNLALHKPVTASGSESKDHAAGDAVDGDESMRWASTRTDNEWITVDLGAPKTIGKVRLSWEEAFAKEYKIQVSDDAQTWRDVVHVTDGQGGEDVHSFAPVTARYLRILGLHRATEYGYSLWELGVYAPDNAHAPILTGD